jgi:GGDEF domain-containing protein
LLRAWSYEAAPAAPAADQPRRGADEIDDRDDDAHDPVTGLPRPGRFLAHLERLLTRPNGLGRSIALLLLEVMDFDRLAARHGEAQCEELLRIIAERLHEEVPEPNLVTRMRRGAFVVVLHDLGPEVTPDALATHLLERAGEPWASGDGLVRWALVGALALPGERAETAIQLLDRATVTLARVRLRGADQPRLWAADRPGLRAADRPGPRGADQLGADQADRPR